MKKLSILILEDCEEDALLILSTLQQAKLEFQHEHVYDQFEYIDWLKKHSPDIILSDYGLKGYNGLAALRDKQEHGIQCPFILVTGSLPDEIAVECLKAGADDYILKDRLSRLPEAIRMVMKRYKAQEDRQKVFNELVLSQKRLAAAERMAQVGNWEWHPLSGRSVWSDEMYRIIGVDQKDYTPTIESFFELMLAEKKDASIDILNAIMTGYMSSSESTFQIRLSNGKVKIVRSLWKSNGKALESGEMRVFGTMQDVTLLYQTEQKLRLMTEELEVRVEERTHELLHTNELLKRKHEEMTDSINYAKLIQKALLAKLDECTRIFPRSFVLWKPRNIVSGDFYWQYQDGQYDYIAAVDCTGHGVPGALMSMIGHQLLNHVVITKGVTEPAQILEALDGKLEHALNGHANVCVHDGMDLILCRIDRKEKQICFAGALRPLFHASASGLQEYPGDRCPIGNFIIEHRNKKFDQRSVKYEQGDCIYLTSDGYYSQFGGPNGKKMMKSRFKALLQKIGTWPIDRQYDHLISFLEQWQGDTEQVDDILVIGIQF